MNSRELWVLMNVPHLSLSDTKNSDNALSEFMSAFIRSTRSTFHKAPVKESEFLDSPSTVWPSGTHFPGGNWRRIYIKVE